MRISDWSSDVCSSDLGGPAKLGQGDDPVSAQVVAADQQALAFHIGEKPFRPSRGAAAADAVNLCVRRAGCLVQRGAGDQQEQPLYVFRKAARNFGRARPFDSTLGVVAYERAGEWQAAETGRKVE